MSDFTETTLSDLTHKQQCLNWLKQQYLIWLINNTELTVKQQYDLQTPEY